MAKRRAQNMWNVTILELLIRGSEIANASEIISMITFWNKSHWNLRKGFVWPLSPIVTKIKAEMLYACVVHSTAIHPSIFSISCNMQDDICTVCYRKMFSLPIGNSFSEIISSKGNSWKYNNRGYFVRPLCHQLKPFVLEIECIESNYTSVLLWDPIKVDSQKIT